MKVIVSSISNGKKALYSGELLLKADLVSEQRASRILSLSSRTLILLLFTMMECCLYDDGLVVMGGGGAAAGGSSSIQ